MSNWCIEKSEAGDRFMLWVGPPGSSGSVMVDNLTRKQGEEIGCALVELIRRERYDVKQKIRAALGLEEKSSDFKEPL